MNWTETEKEANRICDEQVAKGNRAWFDRLVDSVTNQRYVRIVIEMEYEPND